MVKLASLLLLLGAWEKVTESDGITVERRRVPSFETFEVRATVHSKYTPKQIFDVIWNHKEYPQFVPYLKKMQIITDGSTEKDIYEQIGMPIVSDRDYTVHLTTDIDTASGLYQIHFVSSDKGPPANSDFVRVQRIKGGWTLEPAGTGTDVTYFVLSDPGGSIPAWITNSAQKDAAPNFVKAMMKRVEKKNP